MKKTAWVGASLLIGLSSCMTTIMPGSYQLSENSRGAMGPLLALDIYGRELVPEISFDARFRVSLELEIGASFSSVLFVYNEIRPYLVYHCTIDESNRLSAFIALPARFGIIPNEQSPTGGAVARLEIMPGITYSYHYLADNALSATIAYDQIVFLKGEWIQWQDQEEIDKRLPLVLSLSNATYYGLSQSTGLIWINQITLYQLSFVSLATSLLLVY
jgi:hypothetical protein